MPIGGKKLVLPMFRGCLVSLAAAFAPIQDLTSPNEAVRQRNAPDHGHIINFVRGAVSAAISAGERGNLVYANAAAIPLIDTRYAVKYAKGEVEPFNLALEADVQALAAGASVSEVCGAPLWQTTKIPPRIQAFGRALYAGLKNVDHLPDPLVPSRLSEHVETWQIWIDWYTCLLRGHSANTTLMLKIANQPNNFWERSAAEVNADIAALMEKHGGWDSGVREETVEAKTGRDDIEAAVSPEPTIDRGKADVKSNAEFDGFNETAELLRLPERQIGVIEDLLEQLDNDSNFDRAARAAMKRYASVLARDGVHVALGDLYQPAAMVEAQYRLLVAEGFFASGGAVFVGFGFYFDNHAKILSHFPMAKEALDRISTYDLDRSAIDLNALPQRELELSGLLENAIEDEIATERFVEHVLETMRNARLAAEAPAPQSDALHWTKIALTHAIAFFGRADRLIATAAASSAVYGIVYPDKLAAIGLAIREFLKALIG